MRCIARTIREVINLQSDDSALVENHQDLTDRHIYSIGRIAGSGLSWCEPFVRVFT